MTEFGQGPWGARYPIHFQSALTDQTASYLRDAIPSVISLPPHEGRAASSKSFLFMAQNSGDSELCFNVLREIVNAFTGSKLNQIARNILGNDILFLIRNCSIRHHKENIEESRIGPHFDASFIGSDQVALNFWISLDPCGIQSPGLSFFKDTKTNTALWSVFQNYHTTENKEMIDPEIVSKMIVGNFPGRIEDHMFTPVINAGDCLLFDTGTMHCTQQINSMTKDRVSIEYRVCSAQGIPDIYRSRNLPLASFPSDWTGKEFQIHYPQG